MAERKAAPKHAGVSDSAVVKATGKSWKEWFAILDKAGAHKLPHREIAALLANKHLDSPWWAQMITVAYEQARGLRELHQHADGFAASVSKTFNVSLDQLYAAWEDTRHRARWLHEQGVEITRSTANKSLRMLWSDGESRVAVNFYPRGEGKSQVAVEHSKLDSARDAQRAKSSWKSALDELQEWLAKQG